MQNRMKLRFWKIVKNEKCTAEIGELNSVESFFWANYASKKALKGPKPKIFERTNVLEKINWFDLVILDN